MASPQCEDGYTKIANELLEALCKTRIPGEIRQVLDAVIRLTYGWNLKKRPISYREFSNITGLQYGHIYRAIKSLIEHNFIVRDKNGYFLQKNYELWVPYSKNGLSNIGVSKSGVSPTPKMEYFPTPILEYQTGQKTRTDGDFQGAKEIYKEIYKYTHSVCDKVLDVFCNTFNVSESYIQGLIKQHGERVLDYCDYILYLSNKERIRDARRFLAYAIKNGLSPPDGYIPYEQREKKKRERDEALKRLFERQDKEREEIKRRVDAARAYIERIKGTDKYRKLYEKAKGHKMARFLSIERVMQQLIIEGGTADGD